MTAGVVLLDEPQPGVRVPTGAKGNGTTDRPVVRRPGRKEPPGGVGRRTGRGEVGAARPRAPTSTLPIGHARRGRGRGSAVALTRPARVGDREHDDQEDRYDQSGPGPLLDVQGQRAEEAEADQSPRLLLGGHRTPPLMTG